MTRECEAHVVACAPWHTRLVREESLTDRWIVWIPPSGPTFLTRAFLEHGRTGGAAKAEIVLADELVEREREN